MKKNKILSILVSAVMALSLCDIPVNIISASNEIVLDADRSEELIVSKGDSCVLDLNGHKMTGKIENSGILTIKDSGNDGIVAVTGDHAIYNKGTLAISNGTFDALSHGRGAVYNELGATATINGGTFIRSKEAGASGDDGGGNSWYVLFNHGTMTINDANVSSTGHFSSLVENGWYNGNENTTKELSNMTINGGTFEGGINTIKNDDYSNLNITGGTFVNSTQGALMNYNIATISGGHFESSNTVIINTYVNDEMDKGSLSISDGTFIHTGGGLILDYNHDYQLIGNVMITGGLFSADPGHVIDTHKAYKVSNGFKVAPKATKVALSDSALSLEAGKTATLKSTLTPTTTLDEVTYTSSDKNIATVDGNGKVTAVSAGIVTITALAGDKSATCTVTVYKVEPPVIPPVDTTKPVEDVTTGISDKESQQTLTDTTKDIVDKIVSGKDVKNVSEETAKAVKEAVKAGKTVTTEVQVNNLSSEKVSKDEKQDVLDLLTKQAEKNKTTPGIAQFLDLCVMLKADGKELGTVNELNDAVSFTVVLPKNLAKTGRSFYVIRIHDGKTEILPTTMNDDGTLTFKTDVFSTYALVYEDKGTETPVTPPTTPTKGDTVKTSDKSMMEIYVAICGMAMLSFGIVVLIKKKEELSN